MKKASLLSLLLVLLGGAGPALAAEQFGRFFTTPAQRQHLDELRKIHPEQRVKVEEVVLVEDEIEEEEDLPADRLTVRGLVYRGDGKSTAWVNDSNTFEGGLSSQHINVGNIESGKVEIKIPRAEQKVKLSVGQSYDPISENYTDLGKESSREGMQKPPEN